ncbi:hypothetical protein BA065_00490 [Nanoarchaeota archaeon NZ13-N]|uniref:Uncharacterized protein n=1 Tax=Candidatus Nanoclepta minutus TaxID=1940235 RepID=A0A397WNJ9_9ARCH|nr:MAG: hypothetical protein BA065_00490 [Nanoarchaeota archaeon NZ13-N]RIB35654.1 MAG: hypothetical protein BXU00_00950 [Candidatus Nanoclepta minutus]
MDDKLLRLREKLASTSTETLKEYHGRMKQGIIPSSLTEFSSLGKNVIMKYLEKELILRGVIKKKRRVRIY